MFKFKIYTEDKVIHYLICVMLNWDRKKKRVFYYGDDSIVYSLSKVKDVKLIQE